LEDAAWSAALRICRAIESGTIIRPA